MDILNTMLYVRTLICVEELGGVRGMLVKSRIVSCSTFESGRCGGNIGREDMQWRFKQSKDKS
jgi:hypothetical protein